MPAMLRHTNGKRHTWPRAIVEQLETIPESPRAPADFDSPDPTPKPVQPVVDTRSTEELRRAQMLWYSHHLTESQQDRERLGQKIKELETAYRAQSKINAELRKDIITWQNSYDMIEAELVEAAQEIEEAKAYVRSIETSNANLRYTLSQAKEQVESEKRKRWSYRVQKWVTRLPRHLVGLFKSSTFPQTTYWRESSETPVMRNRSPIDRSGAFSRLDRRASDPKLPSSSPQRSLSEKG